MSKRTKLVFGSIFFCIVLIAIFFYILAIYTYNPNKQIVYGVTFSKKFAKQMNLNWQETYNAILDDLKVKYIRIPTYWDEIQPERDIYNYNDIDWMIDEAAKRDVRIILVLGRRQPRWPECHDPAWAKGMSQEELRPIILDNIKRTVEKYKNNQAIEIWQVENEPFLDFFGECHKMTKDEVKEEVDLVRSLDNRRIMLTDSGELSTWFPLIKMADLFGTTLYRITWNDYIGYWRYYILYPSFYRIKAFIWSKPQEAMYVAELQAEPWFPHDPPNTPVEEQFKSMNAKILVENAEFANKTNFYRAYFWGVEWWYWLKIIKNDNSVWEAARKYFK
ncbi:cellulase family glycosylhydrolase [Candidatus Falkowbacteria bacterium]|nr:cellulase family glycosylhydrolase [Candidatus Falkowbacteria bacterium]